MSLNINLSGFQFTNKKDDSLSTSSNFIGSLVMQLRGTLKTAYSFAHGHPSHVYMFTKLSENGFESDFLYQVSGKFVTTSGLNNVGLKNHRFDLSAPRLAELAGYVSTDMKHLTELFESHKKMMPTEIHSWVDETKIYPSVNMGYSFPADPSKTSMRTKLEEWKKQLEKPSTNYMTLPTNDVEDTWFGSF